VRRFGGCIRDGGTVLDLACGSGRHSRYFIRRGHPVTAVDIDTDAIVGVGIDTTPDRDSAALEIIEADLEQGAWPVAGRRFDGIVVVNYLHRPHLPLLCEALTPGGVLLFDTFAVGNERYGRPANPDYLLEPGELLQTFGARLELIAYQHGLVCEPSPAVRQCVCVRR